MACDFSTPKEQVDIVTRGLFAFHFRAMLRRISLFTPLLIGLQVAVVAYRPYSVRGTCLHLEHQSLLDVSAVPWDSRFSLQFPLAFIAMNMRRLVVSGLAPATDRRLCSHGQKDLFAAVLARRIKAIPIAGRFTKRVSSRSCLHFEQTFICCDYPRYLKSVNYFISSSMWNFQPSTSRKPVLCRQHLRPASKGLRAARCL